MSTIPDLNQLRFATSGTTDEHTEGKKDAGFVNREAPSPTGWNWTFNKTFDRFKQLQGKENHKIVGLQAQKDDFTADLLWSEVIDAALEAGDKLGLLSVTHQMTAAKNLSLNDLEFHSQSYDSEINMNGFILTLIGDRLRGELNVINAVAGSIVISGEDMEGLNIRINDAAGVDFVGSGSIRVNGKIITKEMIVFELASQPDHVLMTAAEQALYSNDDRFIRFEFATEDFRQRDGTIIPIDTGDWVVIKSVETLTKHLKFTGDRLKIETHNGFLIPLGNQGSNIPYSIIIRGDSCYAELKVDKTVRGLATVLGDDKFTPMSNNMTAMENRRVIKNQGENNYIVYNRELIFKGGSPTAHLDFVKPNHPYLLEWDLFIYDGLLRDLPAFPLLDNKLKCWFTDMYYWLNRRFNDQLLVPDTSLAYNTVTVPPREARFMRQTGLEDPERHSRTALEGYTDEIIAADYTQVSDKIILQNNPARDIKNVKNGQRVRATGGGIPGGSTGTTIVRPGSIVTTPGSESFRIMNAEDFSPVITAAIGNLVLDFSGMAAGSAQGDAFQNTLGSFEIRSVQTGGTYIVDNADGCISITAGEETDNSLQGSPTSQTWAQINVDPSDYPGAKTSDNETRGLNMFVIPYYRL